MNAATPEPRWLFLDSGRCAPATNMALDEALLEQAARFDAPVLRSYGWASPAATFGYSQRIADVEKMTRLRPLLRRPTGGGLVVHDCDWTYSLMVPADHAWYGLKAEASYRRMHEWLRESFARLGVPTELAVSPLESGPGQCFAGHVQADLLWRGRKIAGAAQRRTRLGLLIQGSVRPPPLGLKRVAWVAALREAAGVAWLEVQPDGDLLGRAAELACKKYLVAAYHRRR